MMLMTNGEADADPVDAGAEVSGDETDGDCVSSAGLDADIGVSLISGCGANCGVDAVRVDSLFEAWSVTGAPPLPAALRAIQS